VAGGVYATGAGMANVKDLQKLVEVAGEAWSDHGTERRLQVLDSGTTTSEGHMCQYMCQSDKRVQNFS
jgi:hypothetical protein